MKTTWRIFALLLFARSLSASGWPSDYPVSSHDRAILMQLFESAGGKRWTNRDKWGTEASPCDWFGVWCAPEYAGTSPKAEIIGLSLALNGLAGTLPPTLPELSGLKTLDLIGNNLSGEFPEAILDLWDQNQFELFLSGNHFSNLVSKLRIEIESSGVRCARDEDVRYFVELTELGPAHFESTRCGRGDTEYRLIREGESPSLVRVERALKKLRVSTLNTAYSYPFTFTTHQVYVTTTVWLGDGTTKSIETYGGQSPVEGWIIEHLVLGLVHEARWKKEIRRPIQP